MTHEKMRIGELAEKAGVTTRTIRYYEDLGLLGPSQREGNGFRYYGETELARMRKIDALKGLGLTLEEISSVIDFYFADPPARLQGKQKVLELLQSHLKETDEKLASLQLFRNELDTNIQRIQQMLKQPK